MIDTKRIWIAALIMIAVTILIAEQPKVRQMRSEGRARTGMHGQHQCSSHDQSEQCERHTSDGMLTKLELTESQQQQVKELTYQNRLAMIDLQAELRKLKLTRQKHLAEADFRNAKRVGDQYHSKKAEITKKRIELTENIYNILDEKQQQEFLKHRFMGHKGSMRRLRKP